MPGMPSAANSWGEMCRSLSIWFMVLSFRNSRGRRIDSQHPQPWLKPPYLLGKDNGSAPGFVRDPPGADLDLALFRCVSRLDFNSADTIFRDGADEIDVYQAVIDGGSRHLDTLGQDEGALELPRRDAAVQVDTLLVVGLLAAHHELVVLDPNREVVHCESGDGERDAQRILAGLFDIVGGVAVGRDLA